MTFSTSESPTEHEDADLHALAADVRSYLFPDADEVTITRLSLSETFPGIAPQTSAWTTGDWS